MKKVIKYLINKYSKLPIINFVFFQRKYQFIGFGLVFINFVFQRVFRINADCKWQVQFTSRVANTQNIKILDYKNNSSVFLSFASSGGCYIQAINGIEIYKDVLWSYGVHLISANHSFKDYSTHEKTKPIVIKNNVWIGANAVVLPSVTIDNFAVVGAGSIVTKDIPAYSIVAGNPAKVIAYRCKKCLDKLDFQEGIYICNSCSEKYELKDYQ